MFVFMILLIAVILGTGYYENVEMEKIRKKIEKNEKENRRINELMIAEKMETSKRINRSTSILIEQRKKEELKRMYPHEFKEESVNKTQMKTKVKELTEKEVVNRKIELERKIEMCDKLFKRFRRLIVTHGRKGKWITASDYYYKEKLRLTRELDKLEGKTKLIYRETYTRQQYLRNVCYKGEEIRFEDKNHFFAKVKSEKPLTIALMWKNEEYMVCTYENEKIKEINFFNFEEKSRFLARMFFEKALKAKLKKDIKINSDIEKKEKESMLEVIKDKQILMEEKIQRIILGTDDLPMEYEYELENHYRIPVGRLIENYQSLSTENQKNQYVELVNTLDNVLEKLDKLLTKAEDMKVFEMKRDIRILKERTRI